MSATQAAAMPRPGCFGSPLCHHANQLPCTRCPFNESCGQVAERVALGLRRKYGIEPLLRRPPTALERRKTKAVTLQWPVKVREHLDRIAARGLDLPRAVRMRANPFADAPPAFLRVSFDLLLRGGFSREELRAHLMRTQSWSDGTALSHVGIAVGVLLGTGAAQEEGGRIIPIPTGDTA
jgi:hypothetical protein